jgi:hypothetical protein
LTPDPTSQNDLNFSHVLVGEGELETFYTPHFAPVATFIRQRHVIGERQRKIQAAANRVQTSL